MDQGDAMARDVTAELIDLVVRELGLDPSGIGPDTKLFDGGLELDSFAVVDLVTRIEAHFGFRLSDDDFRPENFADFRTLGGVVERMLGAPATASAQA